MCCWGWGGGGGVLLLSLLSASLKVNIFLPPSPFFLPLSLAALHPLPPIGSVSCACLHSPLHFAPPPSLCILFSITPSKMYKNRSSTPFEPPTPPSPLPTAECWLAATLPPLNSPASLSLSLPTPLQLNSPVLLLHLHLHPPAMS